MSRYTVVIAPIAAKQIKRLPSKIKSRVGTIISTVIAANPLAGKALKAGLKGLYSYRMGDYRIIYSIVSDKLVIHVIKVMHRKDVYR